MSETTQYIIVKRSKTFYLLFLAEFMMRFSEWSVQSLLVFYLTEHLFFSSTRSYLTYGAFTSLIFAYSFLGGVMADKIVGFKNAAITGMIFALIGNICLILAYPDSMYIGLAFISCGMGLFLPNNPNLLGNLYLKQPQLRDKGFSLYYVATNSGSLIGPLVSGLIAVHFGFHMAFISSATIIALWLVLFLLLRKLFSHIGQPPISEKKTLWLTYPKCLLIAISAVTLFLSTYLLHHPKLIGYLLNALAIFTVSYILYSASSYDKETRNKIILLVIGVLFALVFFALAFQVGSSLLVFAHTYVDSTIFGFRIPASTFAAFEPAFCVLITPAVIKIWKIVNARKNTPPILIRMSIGLLIASLGFLAFSISAQYAALGKPCPLLLFSTGFLLLAAGELCIMPALMASIAANAPSKIKGSIMGGLYLSLAFASYLAGLLATLTSNQTNTANSITAFMNVYKNIFILTLCIGLIYPVVWVIVKIIKKY